MAADESTNTRILIVDDHEDNVEVIRARLEARGYQIESAADGEEALERVRACPPDLILLDVMMPRIDGMEVARRIKADDSLPFIPIIMQTALDTVQHKVEGLDAGADDYVTKPFSFVVLVARLRALIRRGAGERPAVLEAGDLGFDPGTRRAWRGETEVNLTAREIGAIRSGLVRAEHFRG